MNKKFVSRVYCEEGLGIGRQKPRRRKGLLAGEARPPTKKTNESSRMDFMDEQLVGGQRIRLLTVVNNHSRESIAIEFGQWLTENDVVLDLEQITMQRGKQKSIWVDGALLWQCTTTFR